MEEVMYLQNVENGELIQFDSTCVRTRMVVQQWLQADLAFTLECHMTEDLTSYDSLVRHNREEARMNMYEVGIFAHKWHGRDSWRLVPSLDSVHLVTADNKDLMIGWVQDKQYQKLTVKQMQETFNKFVPFEGEVPTYED